MTQETALEIMKTGASIFLTGGAGTGKTYVLNEYISFLKAAGVAHAVTASTGIAGTHLGGMTIHSWSGIGIKEFLSEQDLDILESKQSLYKRLTNVSVLIIDEISMLHAKQLDMVDQVLRHIRKIDAPFGGVQIIFSGDFFQLPPIVRGRNILLEDFVFMSSSWRKLDPVVCYLTEQFRQQEGDLTTILNDIRRGSVSGDSYDLLVSRTGTKQSVPHTKLYTHNIDVDRINSEELEKINEREYAYVMETHGKGPLVESLIKSCLAPAELVLRIGARVMFVKNSKEGKYVNGTIGIVEDFLSDKTPVVRTNDGRKIYVSSDEWAIEDDGKVRAKIVQLPLRLAWAITIHKSQGMSLDAAEIDLSKTFTFGQGYVALSRLRTLAGLSLVGLSDDAFLIHPSVKEFDKKLSELSDLALQAFSTLSLSDISIRQKNFIQKSGGTWPEEGNSTNKKELIISDTYDKTKELLFTGMSIDEIATSRGLTLGTVLTHLETLKKRHQLRDIIHLDLINGDRLEIILGIFKQLKTVALTPVFEYLKKADFTTTYEELRIARLFLE